MKIVIDKNIPFLEGVFEPYAEVVYETAKAINRQLVMDADAIVISTRTRCNEELLEGTAVKMIATSSIGTDHIDLPYCASKGIHIQNTSGSNAGGVMNYVFSALYGVASRKRIKLEGAKLGIIGMGHVGTRIDKMAGALGFQVLRCDPPRARQEGDYGYVSQDELLEQASIVTLHVPLNEQTRGMADEEFFRKMQPGAFFINVGRGEIMVDSALKEAIPKLGAVVIDTWNNEPDVDPELIEMVDIATPHIAGYSYQSMQNGASTIVRTIARFFQFQQLYDFFPETDIKELEAVKVDLKGKTQGEIASIIQYNYPIFTDDFLFREDPSQFERMRATYQYRREFFVD